MIKKALRLLPLPLLSACCCLTLFEKPGLYEVPLNVGQVRQDISFARDFRTSKALRDRARKVIIVTGGGTGDQGVVTVKANSDSEKSDLNFEQTAVISKQIYNSSMSALEKALLREGVDVLDRNEFARLAREKSLKADEAAAKQLLGADAILKIYKVEIIQFTHEQDIREHRIHVRPVNAQIPPYQIEKLTVGDFYCHIDGKLIMSDGTVACVGDVHFPASQLVDPGAYKLVYDLVAISEDGPQYKMENVPAEYVFEWKDNVQADSTWKLPKGFQLTDKNLRNLVIRHAAREFVKRLFSGAE